jgi:hypothetical protein
METKVVFHDGTEKVFADYPLAKDAAKASGRMAKLFVVRRGEWSLWGNVYPGRDDDYSNNGCQPFTNIPIDLFSE